MKITTTKGIKITPKKVTNNIVKIKDPVIIIISFKEPTILKKTISINNTKINKISIIQILHYPLIYY